MEYYSSRISMHGSIVHSSLKTFFMSVCAIIGLFIGFFIILLVLNVIQSAESTPTSYYELEVRPNANGVRKVLSKNAPVVLKLNIDGMIGGESLNSRSVNEILVESRENTLKGDRVKAILLAINSPGGTVNDADGIYRAILNYKKQHNVPVYAYVDGLCASGGMYIASAADKIYSTDTSLIGSVGVLTGPFVNASALMEKIGLSALTLSAGIGKDDLNPLRPWVKGEEKPLQSIVDYYYEYFVAIVTKARTSLSKEKLMAEYGAKIFPAAQAKEYGFIDVVGASYESTLSELVAAIDIDDDYYQVVELTKSAWASLFHTETSLLFGKIKHVFNLPIECDPIFQNPYLYLYKP